MSNNKSNGYSSNGSLVVETHHHFLDELYKMMVKDVYDGGRNRDSKVVEFKHPKELEALMDRSKFTSDVDTVRDKLDQSTEVALAKVQEKLFAVCISAQNIIKITKLI